MSYAVYYGASQTIKDTFAEIRVRQQTIQGDLPSLGVRKPKTEDKMIGDWDHPRCKTMVAEWKQLGMLYSMS